jgi:predicted nucleotidyltransferase
MLPQIETILKLLKNADVEFIVIGGVAMVAHGSAHVTFDIDICYRRTKENITKVCEVLAPFQVKLRGAPSELPLPFRFDVETVRRGLNFTLDSDLGDIDLLGEVSGIGTFEQVLPFSEIKSVDAIECRILTIEGLIRAKKAAGRKKDLTAIEELEGLKDLKTRLGEP